MNRLSDSERIFWTSPELVDMLIPFLDVEACLLYVLVFFIFVSVKLGDQQTYTVP